MPGHGYQAPWWLPGGHVQTLHPLTRRDAAPAYRRERWNTPDGDFIDLDWLPAPLADAPLVVLFHGLEGSSRSPYARALMRAVAARGWRGVVPHFRGCSGEPNRLARAYHSGDSEELDWILRRLEHHAGTNPLFVAGVSLGGNALLKWLGERGPAANGIVRAAAAVCPPLDLAISGHALGRGFNRVYTRHFLNTLKAKALHKLIRHPGLFDRSGVQRARNLFEFDDVYTGPVHGFAGAADYWKRASSRPWLSSIHAPTLLLCAANDPFVPVEALPSAAELSAALTFECHPEGGHVGFPAGVVPGTPEWLPQRLLQHFDSVLCANPAASAPPGG